MNSQRSSGRAKRGNSPGNISKTPVKTPRSEENNQPLTNRGTPQRIRKKNPIFYNDDVLNERERSFRKGGQRTKLEDLMTDPDYVCKSPKKMQALRTAAGVDWAKKSNAPKLSTRVESNKSENTVGEIIKIRQIRKKKKPLRYLFSSDSVQDSTDDAQDATNDAQDGTDVAHNGIDGAHDSINSKEEDDNNFEKYQHLRSKLENITRLPKAFRWILSEFFYSNIDSALFLRANDFQVCLRDLFPQLKTRSLTRREWNIVKRLIGKPRRCSRKFFQEERATLYDKREKIRLLQQRKIADIDNFIDIPEEIPMQLNIGSHVTALVRSQTGCDVFSGQIAAIDTANDTYRVIFDHPDLGMRSIPDYEVASKDELDIFSKTLLLETNRPNSGPSFPISKIDFKEIFGDKYPPHLLENIARLSKALEIKKEQVKVLSEMNSEAERAALYGFDLGNEFRTGFALNAVSLENTNNSMLLLIKSVTETANKFVKNEESAQLTKNASHKIKASIKNLIAFQNTQEIISEGRDLAKKLVDKNNAFLVKNENTLALIKNLTGIMLQMKNVISPKIGAYEAELLKTSMISMKYELSEESRTAFENHVEIHLNYFMKALSNSRNESIADS